MFAVKRAMLSEMVKSKSVAAHAVISDLPKDFGQEFDGDEWIADLESGLSGKGLVLMEVSFVHEEPGECIASKSIDAHVKSAFLPVSHMLDDSEYTYMEYRHGSERAEVITFTFPCGDEYNLYGTFRWH